MRRKTYQKGQNVADVLKFTAWQHVQINSSRWSLSLPTTLAVILSAVALPIVLKVEFNFEVILYITISVFLSPGSCFNSAIRYQNSISKHTDHHVIRGCWRTEKFFTRKVWEDSALPNIPFWGHLNIHLCFSFLFKSQRSNISPRLRKYFNSPQRAVITTVFLTPWLGGHWGCVWGRKSLNNSLRTGGIFSAPPLARDSRSPPFRIYSPKIRKNSACSAERGCP